MSLFALSVPAERARDENVPFVSCPCPAPHPAAGKGLGGRLSVHPARMGWQDCPSGSSSFLNGFRGGKPGNVTPSRAFPGPSNCFIPALPPAAPAAQRSRSCPCHKPARGNFRCIENGRKNIPGCQGEEARGGKGRAGKALRVTISIHRPGPGAAASLGAKPQEHGAVTCWCPPALRPFLASRSHPPNRFGKKQGRHPDPKPGQPSPPSLLLWPWLGLVSIAEHSRSCPTPSVSIQLRSAASPPTQHHAPSPELPP